MTPSSRRLLAAGALLLYLTAARKPFASASMPNARRQAVTASPAPKPWITIGEDGAVRTVTPTVTTSANGAVQTVDGAPSFLTAESTWIMSLSGVATTTVLAPHPAPTFGGSDGQKGGAMMVCDNYYDGDKPFCVPRRGSLLNPGSTYYITWDPATFSDKDQKIKLEVIYDDKRGEFISSSVNVSVGYYAWKLPDDLLTINGKTAMNASIKYIYKSQDSSDFNEIRGNGPRVTITRDSMLPPASPSGTGGPLSLLIAVPVVFALLLALVGGYCCWSYRRKGVIPGAAAVARLRRRSAAGGGRGSQGYGVGQSRSERTVARDVGPGDSFRAHQQPDDKTGGPGIQLTSRESWSPTSPTSPSGRNVFREEIRRQEGQR